MRKWLISSIFIVYSGMAMAQDPVAYIRNYQDIAIAEMLRTGIPASIKLAQAMHESNCGKSELACKANNHFGIKCGGDWRGKSFHKEDDDFDNGKLVKSCFRAYNAVMDSYVAHSDFLADPAKANRYGALFQLDVTDYRGWARGLARAGYATDPQYANRLIDIIEKYELFRFDNELENSRLTDSKPKTSGRTHIIRYQNEIKYVEAAQGDNPLILAQQLDMRASHLLRYNDDIYSEDQELVAGSKVYVQPKRATYKGKQKFHVMKPGEDMVAISQQYGITLQSLLKRNGLDNHETPLPKQKIMLKGKSKVRIRTADPYELPEVQTPPVQLVPTDETITAGTDSKPGPSVKTSEMVGPSSSGKENMDSSHTVGKGDTLFGIARNYGLSVDDLKKRNNLSVDTIYIGQKLVLQ